MSTKEEKVKYYQEKKAELSTMLDSVLDKTLSDPEAMKKLALHFHITRLYRFSLLNTLMIMAQGSELAQSYKNWKRLGRTVKKGEHGNIFIWCPRFKKEVDEDDGKEVNKFKGFTMVKVFDVTQTEGKPLEYAHNSINETEIEYDYFKDCIVQEFKVKINEEAMGSERGFYLHSDKSIHINEANNNIDKVKTLVHELAHHLLDHGNKELKLEQNIKEVEAELVSYLVNSFFKIDTELSEAYISAWKNQNLEAVRKHKIISIAGKIMKLFSGTAKYEDLSEDKKFETTEQVYSTVHKDSTVQEYSSAEKGVIPF